MPNFKTALLAISVIAITFAGTNPDKPAFVDEFIGQIDFVQGRLLQLEGAMPQDKMTWTPAEGVRTCGQIYLHIAEANHMLASFMSGVKMEGERGALEKSTTDKDEIAKLLEDSFTAVKDAAGKLTEEDLNNMVQTPFGMEMSLRNFMISLLNHSHEHLGQGIAYARMNGVTPPWSAKQEDEG
jgi:uncharacterized damage-inducible protein DinB